MPCSAPITNTYVYDIANRLTNVNGQAYTWDDNGNLLSDGTSTYAYDAANRLTSVTQGTTLSSYTYNGLGDRLSQTVNSTTTNYVLDLNAGLTQVLSDGSNTYLYGNGRIGELQPGGFAYHLGDALGSVRQLTNASGSVTLARSFEPYGNTLTTNGTGSTIYQYTGEVRDASGLTFLRARYLSSQTGRFISRDTYAGDFNSPMTQHGYLYAYADPILYTDPSGHDPWWCDYQADPEACRQSYYNAIRPAARGLPLDGYVVLLVCGVRTGTHCRDEKTLPDGDKYPDDYNKMIPLQPIRDLVISNGGMYIYFDTDTYQSKQALSPAIQRAIDDPTNSEFSLKNNTAKRKNQDIKGIFLVGHSAGADAVIMAAYAKINGGNADRIKGVAILDSYLEYTDFEVDPSGNTIKNIQQWGDDVAEYFPKCFFAGKSDPASQKFPTNVEPIEYGGSHTRLAVDEVVAKAIVGKFISSLK